LAFIAAREPWRSTIAGQLSGEDVDAVTSLLGAVPIVKDHRVRIPDAIASFCAKDLPSSSLVAPARLALERCLMAPSLGPVRHHLYRPEHRGPFIRR
jgi:hypothetical protein